MSESAITTKSAQILSDITVFTKYAKYIPEIKRRETWEELVQRNMAMHINKYPKLKKEIQEVYKNFVLTKKVLPSMRSLQFAGKPIQNSPNRIFNCAYMPVDSVDSFAETMFLLLGGTGVGYSVQRHHVRELPSINGPVKKKKRFLIGDSIEGWADAVKILCEAYFYGKARPVFDFSDIRPKGANLVTSGGKAPGPQPLKDCLHNLEKVFEQALEDSGRGVQLEPIQVHDIMCFIADAVLAGGIRRAALISLFSMDDDVMVNAKGQLRCSIESKKPVGDGVFECEVTRDNGHTYTIVIPKDMLEDHQTTGGLPWFFFEPQRGRANNSAAILRHKVSRRDFDKLWQKVEESGSGEPGVFFSNDKDWGTNPCCEIALRPYSFCNLCELNVSNVANQQDLNERAKAAAFIGTLQAGYTDFHYLRDVWKETTDKDALIGVGMTGIASGAVLGLDLQEATEEVLAENARVADKIGVNHAARTNCVKPSGTSSLVLGTSSGIHAWHNDRYIRTMRVGKNEAIYAYLRDNHPHLIEDEAFKPDTSAVISIPQRAPEGAILRNESPLQLLERVARFNKHWVRHGHRDGQNSHNVSVTVSVKNDEWGAVGEWMWEHRNDFNGISVLPHDGGNYVQAPFQDVTDDQDQESKDKLELFTKLEDSLDRIDLTQVREEEDNTDLTGEIACGADGCIVT